MKKATIIAELRRGTKVTVIASRVGCSKAYVSIIRRQCGMPPRSPGRPWTEADVSLLRSMRSRKIPYAAVAGQVGRTVNAVRNAASRFRLAGARGKGTDKGELRRMVERGMGDRQIGRELGIHPQTVRWHRKRLRLPANLRHRPWTPDEVATCRRILAGGGTLWNAARAVGRTRRAVQVALKRHTTEEASCSF